MLDCRSQAGILPENVILGNSVEISRYYKQKLSGKRYEIQFFLSSEIELFKKYYRYVNNWTVQGGGGGIPVLPLIILWFPSDQSHLSIKMTDF